MKSIFRATAILTSSSVASILLSLISAKVMALYIHPDGYGYYGLLQSFVAVSSLIGGMGMATGIVRLGAAAASRDEVTRIASLRKASWLIFVVFSVFAASVLFAARNGISQLVLGRSDHGGMIMLMGIATLFTVAANLQVGTLNAYHRVTALAKYGVFNTFLSSGVGIASVIIWRARGIPVAILGGAIATWTVSQLFLNHEIGRAGPVSFAEVLVDAKALMRFGTPYMASMFVGTGVQMILPILVLHLLDAESVGYYRAAAGISVGYLGFLITAMGQDYYPRVSAIASQPAQLVSLINAQHRLVMLLAIPMILGTLTLAPYLVPLIYSAKFHATVDILEWQLIGDLFKFSSWTMSFAILARCSTSMYFLVECIGGVVTLSTTWLCVKWVGIPGLGISFLVTYVVYYCVVWIVIRREIPLRWTITNRCLMLLGIIGAMTIRILPSTQFSHDRTAIALVLALAASISSIMILWRDYKALGDDQGAALVAGNAARPSLRLS
jgi:O-antigen/teichoic acid export membrane protein